MICYYGTFGVLMVCLLAELFFRVINSKLNHSKDKNIGRHISETFSNGSVLALTFWRAVEDDNRKFAIITIVLIVVLHLILAIGFKLYFFKSIKIHESVYQPITTHSPMVPEYQPVTTHRSVVSAIKSLASNQSLPSRMSKLRPIS